MLRRLGDSAITDPAIASKQTTCLLWHLRIASLALADNATKKIIAVIGGTGAQGRAVVQALLADNSPFAVRILTRSTSHPLAKELAVLPRVELVEGAIQDSVALARILDGAYGAFVNTDSFTLGEAAELHIGVRIYEAARRAGVRHFVWSSLEYKLKENGYDERYDAPHYSAKGRVWEFVKSQAAQDESGMVCTALVTGPYMESLSTLYGPIGQRKSDGAFVFANPWTEGEHFPFVALRDIGFFARWIFFDNGLSSSSSTSVNGQEIRIISQLISPTDLVQAFEHTTGQKAVFIPLSHEDFIASLAFAQRPVASDVPQGKTFADMFRAGLRIWTEPGQVVRDMEWVRRVNPQTRTVEDWMRETGYDGGAKAAGSLLKAHEGAEVAPRVLAEINHLLE